MSQGPKINNGFRTRGRVVRDPYFSEKDGRTKAIMFTVMASRQYTNAAGDDVTANDYIEVKVFNQDAIKFLKDAGLSKGSIVVAFGRAAAELNEFEKDGQKRQTARLVVVVENEQDHTVEIEQIGNEEAA